MSIINIYVKIHFVSLGVRKASMHTFTSEDKHAIPADTRRNNKVIITSKRRHNVVSRNNDIIIASRVRNVVLCNNDVIIAMCVRLGGSTLLALIPWFREIS